MAQESGRVQFVLDMEDDEDAKAYHRRVSYAEPILYIIYTVLVKTTSMTLSFYLSFRMESHAGTAAGGGEEAGGCEQRGEGAVLGRATIAQGPSVRQKVSRRIPALAASTPDRGCAGANSEMMSDGHRWTTYGKTHGCGHVGASRG